MHEISRNSPCRCGSGKKYKKCCLVKDEKRIQLKNRVIKITRHDFITGPYRNCPNPECLADNSFGVFMPMAESRSYSRECIKCCYQEHFELPRIEKKIIYLDQFVISNLVKLLDRSHSSHKKIKADPFWEQLFIKLEKSSNLQAIVCPDSFYHRDESMVGDIEFKLMKRLYEHFSGGKTFFPSMVVEKSQIAVHFDSWLATKKANFDFAPERIVFGGNLHSWSNGMRVSVGGKPYPGEVEDLLRTNKITREHLKDIWTRWQSEKGISFVDRIREETAGLWKGFVDAAKQFAFRREAAMKKIAAGENYDMELDDFMPPMPNEILDSLILIARKKKLPEQVILETIKKYFADIDGLLEIPQIRISSVMFAGWAHLAANGKKFPPKSTTDVQFISTYLPYCDALFVDNESAQLLKEFPKDTPIKFRLKEFNARIFSLVNKGEFLDYLDGLVAKIPASQMEVLNDMEGVDYGKPYWSIIEREKREIERKISESTGKNSPAK